MTNNIKYINFSSLIEDGWTEEKIICLLGRKKTENTAGWSEEKIIAIKNSKLFKEFTTLENYLTQKENAHINLQNNQKISINISENITRPTNSLINNWNNFIVNGNLPEQLFLLHDTNINQDQKYYLFTDGCFKSLGEHEFSSCAGHICDENGKPILEFANRITFDLPQFELQGIKFGIELCKKLGIKNILCATDSSSLAHEISMLQRNIYIPNFKSKKELLIISDLLNDIKGEICYIPRQHNSFADELSKIQINFRMKEQKNIIPILSKNTIHDDNDVLFDNSNLNKLKNDDNQYPILVSRYYDHFFYNFILTNPDEIKFINKVELNAEKRITNLIQVLTLLSSEYSELSINADGFLSALFNQKTTIKNNRKNEFFDLQNITLQFNKIYLTNNYHELNNLLLEQIENINQRKLNPKKIKKTKSMK